MASWCYNSEWMSAIHLLHHSYTEAWEGRGEALPRLLDIVLSRFLGSQSASWVTRQVNCLICVQCALVTSRRLKMKKPRLEPLDFRGVVVLCWLVGISSPSCSHCTEISSGKKFWIKQVSVRLSFFSSSGGGNRYTSGAKRLPVGRHELTS